LLSAANSTARAGDKLDRVKRIEREREKGLNSGNNKTNTTSTFGHLLFQVELSYVVTEREDTDTTYCLYFTI